MDKNRSADHRSVFFSEGSSVLQSFSLRSKTKTDKEKQRLRKNSLTFKEKPRSFCSHGNRIKVVQSFVPLQSFSKHSHLRVYEFFRVKLFSYILHSFNVDSFLPRRHRPPITSPTSHIPATRRRRSVGFSFKKVKTTSQYTVFTRSCEYTGTRIQKNKQNNNKKKTKTSEIKVKNKT